MKIKSYKKFIINFEIIKFFKKKYEKLFNSLYKQKLNSIILHLLENKIEINTVYDVGAFQGDWTKLLKKTSLKNSKFYLFEANTENEIYLRNSGHKYFINVLSDKNKNVKFFSKVHAGDSYFPEKTNFYDNTFVPKNLKAITLNEIQKKNQIPKPDFLKIDTQGSEIDILKGGNEILNDCKIILLECPIISYNTGAPTLSNYIEYLDKINYLPLEIAEIHYLDKILVQIDIVFLKKNIFQKIYKDKKMLKLFNK
ncbi:FkbM family methyltransferase [Candidatus Pelagibacter sp.]|jgi:FkbM family methyltransferase|nr:FkbM family methyltransferase [Candidatus Pelagibacter sp.]